MSLSNVRGSSPLMCLRLRRRSSLVFPPTQSAPRFAFSETSREVELLQKPFRFRPSEGRIGKPILQSDMRSISPKVCHEVTEGGNLTFPRQLSHALTPFPFCPHLWWDTLPCSVGMRWSHRLHRAVALMECKANRFPQGQNPKQCKSLPEATTSGGG